MINKILFSFLLSFILIITIWAQINYESFNNSKFEGIIDTQNQKNYNKVDSIGTLKWRYRTGSPVGSSPAIGIDGTIYVGSDDGYLYAINPDGTLKWCYRAGGGVGSSPAIGSDGTIYVGSYNGYLYAINPDSTLKWHYQIHTSASSPAIGLDGTIYIGSDYEYLYAINPDSTLKWRYSTGSRVTSSPAIGSNGTIYFGLSNSLYAINPNGTYKWRYRTGSRVNSSPAIGSDGTIYVGSDNYYLYAINPDSTLKWRYQIPTAISSPAIGSDGTIYIGSNDGYLYAINLDNTLKWRYLTGGNVFSSPVIGSDGIIYVGSNDGYLYAINGSGQLANTPWPMFHHDLMHTGRFMQVNYDISICTKLPKHFYLTQPKPNPFGKGTHISYGLPIESDVQLCVFDAVGRKVRNLVISNQSAGYYSAIWDGKDEQKRQLANGIYFIRIRANEQKFLRKAVLMQE